VVDLAEDVTLDGQDLALPANVIVYGHLTLTNSTLRFTPVVCGDKRLLVYGRLDATGSTITTTNGVPVNLFVNDTGVANLTDYCTLSPVSACFQGSSANTLTDCTFGDYHPSGCHFWGDSSSTVVRCTFNSAVAVGQQASADFTDCDFLEFRTTAMGASNSTFTGCTFKQFEAYSPAAVSFRHSDTRGPCRLNVGLNLHPAQDTDITLTGLSPGEQPIGTIQATNNDFDVDLGVDPDDKTWVEAFLVTPEEESIVHIEGCQLLVLDPHHWSQTTVAPDQLDVPSEVGCLLLSTSGGYKGQPINLTIQDYRDDRTPQTTDITSGNSPFRVSFINSAVGGAGMGGSVFRLGDTRDPENPGYNRIDNSSIYLLTAYGGAAVEVHDSVLWNSGGVEDLEAGSTAHFKAYDCSIASLVLRGTPATAEMYGGSVEYFAFLHTYGTAAPHLVFSRSPYTDRLPRVGPGGDPRCLVDDNVCGATISGRVEIDATRFMDRWASGSTITREFPVVVLDQSQQPVAGAPVHVYDLFGDLVWEGATGPTGSAQPVVTFDESNYSSEFRGKAWASGGVDSAPLHFLSSTPITLRPGEHPLSFSDFEETVYPWTTFGSGGEAATWRQLGGAEIPRGGVTAPAAHSGDYAMLCDVGGEGITGLRLDLPEVPTFSAWVNVVERSASGSSAFIGFTLGEDPPSSASGWSTALGYEVSDSEGRLWLGDGSWVSDGVPGLATGAWRQVQIRYDPIANRLKLWIDGVLVAEKDTPLGLAAPTHALLGAWGQGSGARQTVCFDDADIALPPTAPPLLPLRASAGLGPHLYATLDGPQWVVEGRPWTYVLSYGNGYPVVGGSDSPGSPPSEPVQLSLSLPAGMEFLGSTPEPTVPGVPAWQVTAPYLGQECYIFVEAQMPTGTASGQVGAFSLWRDAGAYPEDLLPQYVLTHESLLADLWTRKEGPAAASPGEVVNYQVTVGNRGYAPAASVVVRDAVPPELGGGMGILANLEELAPNEVWRGVLTARLNPDLDGGTVVTNDAFAESDSVELSYLNDHGTCDTTVQVEPDPNRMSVSVTGGVERGDPLTYTVACQNGGAGAAYGVYATLTLDPRLDDNTLSLPSSMSYDPVSRILVWQVGTLPAGGSASASFTVQVPETARRARPIAGQATIHFPSLAGATPTNVVVNVVNGSFSDVPWDHGAVLSVQLAYENGIVTGYRDGTYRPAVTVNRDQMAVFIARSLAGCDDEVPDGPLTPRFSDVGTSFWAYKYIEYCVATGIVVGYSDGTYRPANPVNRGQMAAYIARALAGGDGGVPPGPGQPTFGDVATDHPYYKYIEYIADRGVAGGYADGTYRPTVTVNRGQMAIYVARAFALPM
jgi:uncharacterized repeat protein (TIGR01451 family)